MSTFLLSYFLSFSASVEIVYTNKCVNSEIFPSILLEYRELGVTWFTNLEIPKRSDLLDLVCHYSEENYPHYEDQDAIDVSDTFAIPFDYNGVIGVPITFLYYFNPEQFEIINCCEPCIRLDVLRKMPKFKEYKSRQKICHGFLCQKKYHRFLIRNKHPERYD